MDFDPEASFEANLQSFKGEVERLDPECARILFDHLEMLARDGDIARSRQAIQEFNRAVLLALATLP
jgi:hypothetical protein